MSMVSCPMIWTGVGLFRNLTLLGRASSWSDTILTAVRSSMESPNETISRRNVGLCESGAGEDGVTAAVGFMGVLSQLVPPGESASADEREVSPNDESSVDAKSISGTESSNFDTSSLVVIHAALSNKLCASSNEQKCSFTSCAKAAAFQHSGWLG